MAHSTKPQENRIPKHCLGLIIRGDSRSARERLIADVRRRAESKTDPFVSTDEIERIDRFGVTEIMAGIFVPSKKETEALLRRHRQVEVLAMVFSSGSVPMAEIASFRNGERLGPWSTSRMDPVTVTIIAAGPTAELARFVDVSANPDACPAHAPLLTAMRSIERDRRLANEAFRLDLHMPVIDGFARMAVELSCAFPSLRFNFLACPDDAAKDALLGALVAGKSTEDLECVDQAAARLAIAELWNGIESGNFRPLYPERGTK